MAQQTNCPACGAPLEYTGQNDIVSCDFCNAQLQVVRENDETYFRVLSQPGPQKEVLSTPVEPTPVEPQVPGASIFDLPGEPPAVTTPLETTPPPAPAAFSSDLPPFAPSGPVEGAQVYPPAAPPASSSSRNWILIAVGIVAGVCLLCLCMGVVLMLIFGASAGGSF